MQKNYQIQPKAQLQEKKNDFLDRWRVNRVAADQFWKDNVEKERNHLYKSTVVGLQMGKINELPLNERQASRLNQNQLINPFQLAEAIKSKKLELSNIGNQLGKKYIFGGDSPNSVSKFTPFDEQKYAETKFQMQNELYPSMSKMVMKSKYNKQRFVSPVGQSIRTYGVKEKMPYMDSSIDLTQDDYKRVAYHQNQDQFNMNEFRMKVAERSGRYKNDLQFGSTLTNPTQKFKVSNSFQTIEQQPIGDSDKILQQNGIQSLKSHKDLNLTQKIVIDNGYRHPYEWNLNNPTGPLGVLPDNKKITEISRDEGHALRKNASQLMQPFYDTKDSPTRQNKRYDSVIISPSNTKSIAQDSQIYNGTQSSHFQNFSRIRQDKINQYQKTLGIIEEPFKEVKLPALSHHRQQF